MAILYVATKGLLDDIPTPRVKEFEAQFTRFLDTERTDVMKKLAATKVLDDDTADGPRGGGRRVPQDIPGVAGRKEAACQASETSEGASRRRGTSGRSPGRCSSWPRRSCAAPRSPRSPPGPTRSCIDEILADLAAVLGGDEHPLLSRREEGKRLIVLVTSDRGLAGPLNTNAVRFAAREIVEHPGDLELVSVGRKGRDAMRRARVPIVAHFPGFGDRPTFDDILPLARLISDEYVAGTYSQVDIVFTRFVSTLVQRAEMVQLLPIKPSADTRGIPGAQFIFEPAPEVVLERAAAALRRAPASTRPPSRARPASSPARWWP